jgi:hypothetical protein
LVLDGGDSTLISPVDGSGNLSKMTMLGAFAMLVADMIAISSAQGILDTLAVHVLRSSLVVLGFSVMSLFAVVMDESKQLSFLLDLLEALVSKDLSVFFLSPIGHVVQGDLSVITVLRVVHLDEGLLLLVDGETHLVLLLSAIRLAMLGQEFGKLRLELGRGKSESS